MTDSCIVCETDALELDEWYFCEKTHEFVCPWCIKDMYKVKMMFK